MTGLDLFDALLAIRRSHGPSGDDELVLAVTGDGGEELFLDRIETDAETGQIRLIVYT